MLSIWRNARLESLNVPIEMKNQKNINPHKKKVGILNELLHNRVLYLMLVPGILLTLVYKYIPLFYQIIAFQEYSPVKGILGSDFVGLAHFKRLFTMPDFWRVFQNTLILGFGKQIVNFTCALVFALLLNEMRIRILKKTIQTVSFFPNLISWTVAGGIVLNMLSIEGVANTFLKKFAGFENPVEFFIDDRYFRSIVIASDAWKNMGSVAVILIAAIAGINAELYEAAIIDGAGRWKQMRYITLPGISVAIITVILLNLQYVINVGPDQILVLYSPNVYSKGDILDTYIYRVGTINAEFAYATAVGMFKSVIAFVIVFFTNATSRKMGDARLF